ncbi:MAG: flippase-like domain-containing protein [Pyrinomonadaceae bacterium]|nr:flippase-like domain-containing protein [Pyrinomonadaceae bacterium]
MNIRKLFVLTLKIAFAVAVLVWMTHTGKLNFAQVGAAFRQWPQVLGIVAIICVQIAIMTWRWNMLTNALGFGLHYREAFSLSLIGLLFTVVIPGSVGGDVMKAYYVGKRVSQGRAQAITTVLVDRYLGLLSLLALGSIGVVLNFEIVSQHSALATLATFITIAFAGGAALLVIAVLISGRVSGWMRRLEVRLPALAVLVRCWDSVKTYRNQPRVLFTGMLISLPAHFLACIGFYLAMTAVNGPQVSPERLLLVIPIALITTAIPLSPGGVGIGQAAVYALFNAVEPVAAESASNAFTVYQTLQIAVFLTGFVPYFAWSDVRSEAAEVAT